MTREQAATVQIGTRVAYRGIEGAVTSIRTHGMLAPYFRTTIEHPSLAPGRVSYGLFDLADAVPAATSENA